MSFLKIKKTSSLKTRCFSCRKQQIRCKPSIESPNICQYCFKKNYNENKYLKTSPKYYPDEIKRLNSIVIENKLYISDLEKHLPTSEESTTNSTTIIPPSSTSSTKTTSTRTTSELSEPISDSDVSCQICKIKLKQTEIEEHLKEHLKNPLSKDFIYNKLQIKSI
ncbi:hypothetical protein C2G38_2228462 [Gigaspora rosea]|uniref:Uncharacterized protein n=1 Tax=Gigaspora rosea TaxID=44941 RepID=A0A397TVQ4_9GLOM|nr:hypothetical protein C2G38_2228462 [Gigaspora rosea]